MAYIPPPRPTRRMRQSANLDVLRVVYDRYLGEPDRWLHHLEKAWVVARRSGLTVADCRARCADNGALADNLETVYRLEQDVSR